MDQLVEIKNGVTKVRGESPTDPIVYDFPAVEIVVYPSTNRLEICRRTNNVPTRNLFFDQLTEADKKGATDAEGLADVYANGGFFFKLDTSAIKYIDIRQQLPDALGGVIDLGDNAIQYTFTSQIDVQGATVDFGNNIITGLSQEKGGLDNASIIIDQTCTCKSVRFNSCSMTIDAVTGAFDWQFVNFYDCQDITFVNAANVIWQTFGFIDTFNVQVTGTVDSLVISPNSIWRSETTQVCDFFAVRSTATINRRIRIEDTVFVTDFATQNPINVEAGATIPIEGFRLQDIAFIGLGSLTGINGDDDRAFFRGCTGDGVINSTSIANMYMQENQTSTPTPVQGDKYKVIGTTLISSVIQRFTHDALNNTLEYTSSVSRIFRIQTPYTVFAGNNNVVGTYIAVTRQGNLESPNTDIITESEMYTTTNGARPISGMSQAIVTLNQGDKVYFAVENENGNSVRVEFMNMIIETANV